MKQAKLFSFFKKSADQSSTTTATAAAHPAVSAASNHQNESEHAANAIAIHEEIIDSQQQPFDAVPIPRAINEVQTQQEAKALTEVDRAFVDDESKEQPPPTVILQSLGRSTNSDSKGSSSSSSSSNSASMTGSSSTSNVLTSGSNQMSDYERIREENIRRNQAFLMSLGLAGPDAMKPMGSAQTAARPGTIPIPNPNPKVGTHS